MSSASVAAGYLKSDFIVILRSTAATGVILTMLLKLTADLGKRLSETSENCSCGGSARRKKMTDDRPRSATIGETWETDGP
jgi:hypothetical protein